MAAASKHRTARKHWIREMNYRASGNYKAGWCMCRPSFDDRTARLSAAASNGGKSCRYCPVIGDVAATTPGNVIHLRCPLLRRLFESGVINISRVVVVITCLCRLWNITRQISIPHLALIPHCLLPVNLSQSCPWVGSWVHKFAWQWVWFGRVCYLVESVYENKPTDNCDLSQPSGRHGLYAT